MLSWATRDVSPSGSSRVPVLPATCLPSLVELSHDPVQNWTVQSPVASPLASRPCSREYSSRCSGVELLSGRPMDQGVSGIIGYGRLGTARRFGRYGQMFFLWKTRRGGLAGTARSRLLTRLGLTSCDDPPASASKGGIRRTIWSRWQTANPTGRQKEVDWWRHTYTACSPLNS